MLKVVRSFAFRRSASNLVLAEVNAAGELQAGSLSAITAAQQIGGDITAIGIFSFNLNARFSRSKSQKWPEDGKLRINDFHRDFPPVLAI